MTNSKTVLVLDACQRSALAVTRSLGKKDIKIFTADETSSALAGHSKYSINYFTYPSPRLYPEHFIEILNKKVIELHVDILLPMTELSTMLLLMHKASFPHVVIPFPELHVVDSLSDKCLLMKSAQSLDIPIPKTWYADDPNNLPCDLSDLPYPIVLKPGKSWLHYEGQWRRAAVRYANNPVDAKRILNSDWALKSHPFMIQECVDGYGAGVFAIYNNGNFLCLFAHRRLREKPPSGGVSVLSESITVEPELGSHARALLENVNWHGIAMVEFKVSSDGTPHLMEINTRFWGSLQLAIDAGVNFPYMLYRMSCGKQADPVNNYKTGVRLRWLLGDIDNLYLTLRDPRISFKSKLIAIKHFLTPLPFITRHEVNRWRDLGPAWYEIKQYVLDILK